MNYSGKLDLVIYRKETLPAMKHLAPRRGASHSPPSSLKGKRLLALTLSRPPRLNLIAFISSSSDP